MTITITDGRTASVLVHVYDNKASCTINLLNPGQTNPGSADLPPIEFDTPGFLVVYITPQAFSQGWSICTDTPPSDLGPANATYSNGVAFVPASSDFEVRIARRGKGANTGVQAVKVNDKYEERNTTFEFYVALVNSTFSTPVYCLLDPTIRNEPESK